MLFFCCIVQHSQNIRNSGNEYCIQILNLRKKEKNAKMEIYFSKRCNVANAKCC